MTCNSCTFALFVLEIAQLFDEWLSLIELLDFISSITNFSLILLLETI